MYQARGSFRFRLVYVSIILLSIVTGLVLPVTPASANPKHTPFHTNYKASELVAMNDEELLDILSKKAFDYFWLEANPDNGLIRHYNDVNSPSGIQLSVLGLLQYR